MDVSWTFIFEVCQKFKFNDIFISWLKMIYNTPKAMIRVNGIISDSFSCFRGTRQGDPLSSLIFILAMEPFAERIRQTCKIQGLLLGQEEQKLVKCG